MPSRNNNFDLLRVLAALGVLFSHGFPLTDGTNRAEPLARLSHGQTTVGSVAVMVFFVMSGALITASFLRARSAFAFIALRALRILPALWVILPLLAFVVGPFVTTLPAAQYFGSSQPYLFVLHNMVLFHTENLPGIFAHNPYPAIMDGSLWTLGYEVICYGIVLLLGVFGLLRPGVMLAIYLAALAVCLHRPADLRTPLACAFCAGALFELTIQKTRPWLAAICAAGWCLALWTPHYVILACLLAPYPILAAARAAQLRLPVLRNHGDVSYGLYIYAFPIQQSISMALGPRTSWIMNDVIAVPLALLCAFGSWHWIERPALGLKARLLFERGSD